MTCAAQHLVRGEDGDEKVSGLTANMGIGCLVGCGLGKFQKFGFTLSVVLVLQ